MIRLRSVVMIRFRLVVIRLRSVVVMIRFTILGNYVIIYVIHSNR